MNHYLPPSLPSTLYFVFFLCVYVRSPGIYEVLQECGDKAKAVAVRHSFALRLCYTVCRCTHGQTYFIRRK